MLAACCRCFYESHGLPNGQATASDASDGLPFGSMCYNRVMQDPTSQSTAEQRIWTILADIDDPEMPISIVDLGIIERVEVSGGKARIFVTPTFTGCPALQMIDEQIVQSVGGLPEVDEVEIEHIFDPPWRADRITPAGRERLRAHGVTVPSSKFVQLQRARDEAVACPFCNSQDTRLDSPFGPTRCRMIYYCLACRNTFEHIKAI